MPAGLGFGAFLTAQERRRSRRPSRQRRTGGNSQVRRTSIIALAGAAAVALASCGSSKSSTTTTQPNASTTASASNATPLLARLSRVSTLGSTIPANGDVNPYGLVTVPSSTGNLKAGNLLVSNFNDKANNQGTGTTIVQMTPSGKLSLFAAIDAKTLPGACPGGVGLTSALNILPGGYVVVGSLPTTDGKSATAQYGCLIVLDSSGKVVKTIAGANIQGPWGSTAVSEGPKTTMFVSMALNGGAAKGVHTIDNSTVVRFVFESGAGQPPKVQSEQVIANGIPWVDSPTALVIGPTGVALASNGTLYVADTLVSRITAVPQAMTRTTPASKGGTTVSEGGHLKEPLGLVLAPNGNIVTTNAGDGNMVETTPAGQQVAVQTADKKTGAGSLFGLAIAPEGKGIYFVDDGENTLDLLHEAGASPAARTGTSTTNATHSATSSATTTTPPAATTTSATSKSTPTKAAPKAPSGEQKLSIEANSGGQLKYDKSTLSANAGKVSIDFTNMAPLGHNFTVASASGSTLGATPTFQGGSKTLTLTLTPGTYKYFCTVPGHRMAGMEGTLTVK
jgi:plastocyanin